MKGVRHIMQREEYISVDFYRLVLALSSALDLISVGLGKHHIQVALITAKILENFRLDSYELSKTIYAAMVHDIGVSSHTSKKKIVEMDDEGSFYIGHAIDGCRLLEKSSLLGFLSETVLHHHDRWDGKYNISGLSGARIPLGSRVIYLADRIAILLTDQKNILNKYESIITEIKKCSGKKFDPDLVNEFLCISKKPTFWLDITSSRCGWLLERYLMKNCNNSINTSFVDLDGLLDISNIFAEVVDAKSSFTYMHSKLVSAVAKKMAIIFKFPEDYCNAIKIAGLLHDLGKLAIPDEILEKPGKLTKEEINIMKSHPYYTYHILDMVPGFEKIKEWAAYHHECLDGSGYPFVKTDKDLSREARLMAVSDIFTALIENRPYRSGMNRITVENTLKEKVSAGHLDKIIVEAALDNYKDLETCKEILYNKYTA